MISKYFLSLSLAIEYLFLILALLISSITTIAITGIFSSDAFPYNPGTWIASFLATFLIWFTSLYFRHGGNKRHSLLATFRQRNIAELCYWLNASALGNGLLLLATVFQKNYSPNRTFLENSVESIQLVLTFFAKASYGLLSVGILLFIICAAVFLVAFGMGNSYPSVTKKQATFPTNIAASGILICVLILIAFLKPESSPDQARMLLVPATSFFDYTAYLEPLLGPILLGSPISYYVHNLLKGNRLYEIDNLLNPKIY